MGSDPELFLGSGINHSDRYSKCYLELLKNFITGHVIRSCFVSFQLQRLKKQQLKRNQVYSIHPPFFALHTCGLMSGASHSIFIGMEVSAGLKKNTYKQFSIGNRFMGIRIQFRCLRIQDLGFKPQQNLYAEKTVEFSIQVLVTDTRNLRSIFVLIRV